MVNCQSTNPKIEEPELIYLLAVGAASLSAAFICISPSKKGGGGGGLPVSNVSLGIMRSDDSPKPCMQGARLRSGIEFWIDQLFIRGTSIWVHKSEVLKNIRVGESHFENPSKCNQF